MKVCFGSRSARPDTRLLPVRRQLGNNKGSSADLASVSLESKANDQRLAFGRGSNSTLRVARASRSGAAEHSKEIGGGSTATATPHRCRSYLLRNCGWCALLSASLLGFTNGIAKAGDRRCRHFRTADSLADSG